MNPHNSPMKENADRIQWADLGQDAISEREAFKHDNRVASEEWKTTELKEEEWIDLNQEIDRVEGEITHDIKQGRDTREEMLKEMKPERREILRRKLEWTYKNIKDQSTIYRHFSQLRGCDSASPHGTIRTGGDKCQDR